MSKEPIIVKCQNCGCDTEIPHKEYEDYCYQCFLDMGYEMGYE